ncbi:hypothetical protein M0802_004429 [Mischocyttarus mexicanus]|nr:hypothetical protein M0802_004429 [Mischocyttarus mexicanus]
MRPEEILSAGTSSTTGLLRSSLSQSIRRVLKEKEEKEEEEEEEEGGRRRVYEGVDKGGGFQFLGSINLQSSPGSQVENELDDFPV